MKTSEPKPFVAKIRIFGTRKAAGERILRELKAAIARGEI